MSPSSHSLFSNVSLSEESEIYTALSALFASNFNYGGQEDSLSNKEDSLSWEDSLMTVSQNATR